MQVHRGCTEKKIKLRQYPELSSYERHTAAPLAARLKKRAGSHQRALSCSRHHESMVLWRVILTTPRVLCGRHDANELHHPAIFMREDVTVEYVCADEV